MKSQGQSHHDLDFRMLCSEIARTNDLISELKLSDSQGGKNNSLFKMASNSQALTAAGVLVLVDEGPIDLDVSIGTYLQVKGFVCSAVAPRIYRGLIVAHAKEKK